MKIIRWLLSHTFLILLIVLVIYGYMFWGNLLGKDTPAGKAIAYVSDEFVVVKDFVDAVKEKQTRLNAQKSTEQQMAIGGNEITQSDVVVTESTPTEVIVTEKITTRIERQRDEADSHESMQAAPALQGQQPAVRQQAIQQQAVQQQAVQQRGYQQDHAKQINPPVVVASARASNDLPNTSPAEGEGINVEKNTESREISGRSAENKKVDVQVSGNTMPKKADQDTGHNGSGRNYTDANSNDKGSFVSPDIEKQLDNVDTQGRVIDETQNASIRSDWITARKSFYQRNYALSEQSYQKVIDKTVDNFDAYGELGNVYFNQGKNKQAASAYYESAAILVRKGEVTRAKSLMGLLRHLEKSKADDLQKLIDSEQS